MHLACLILSILISAPAQAQSIKIGLQDNAKILYISANQNYTLLEDQSQEQGSFQTVSGIIENSPGQKILIRSSPAAANDLLIASPPTLITTSSALKLACTPQAQSKIRISNFDSRKAFQGDLSGVEISTIERNQSKPCLFKIKTSSHDKNPNNIFRGDIIVIPHKTHFTIINQVDMEDYLRSVVASEVSSSWHPEALKTQAVAARTYTLSHLGRRKALGYDLKSGVEDQMYLGYNRETAASTQAVKGTQGEYLIDQQGLYVDAYYYSHAGNFSSSPEDVWGLKPKHYLQAVNEITPLKKPWQADFTLEELETKLQDLRLEGIEAITISKRSPEGRASQVIISGTQASKPHHITLTGEEFRHHLGLRSTNFDLAWTFKQLRQTNAKEKGFFAKLFSAFDGQDEATIKKQKSELLLSIKGQGYGHGIGLSQYDCKYLAERGAKYPEILGHYYQGARLAK